MNDTNISKTKRGRPPKKNQSIDEKYNAPFPTRLRGLMDTNKMQNKELAEITGVTAQMVSYWKTGENTPDINKICVISNHFKVSIDYLLGLSPTPSIDEDIQTACKVTGLSEEAVMHIKELTEFDSLRLESMPSTLANPSKEVHKMVLNELLLHLTPKIIDNIALYYRNKKVADFIKKCFTPVTHTQEELKEIDLPISIKDSLCNLSEKYLEEEHIDIEYSKFKISNLINEWILSLNNLILCSEIDNMAYCKIDEVLNNIKSKSPDGMFRITGVIQ